MRSLHQTFLATGFALALGACDMIGGESPGASGGYRVAEAPAPILAAAPPPDLAMDDYICRRNGVLLDVGAESCAEEGGFVSLRPATGDPIQWTADMWAPPAMANLPMREDRALSRAEARPALAALDFPPAPPAEGALPRPPRADFDRPQAEAWDDGVSGFADIADTTPFDDFSAQPAFAASPPPPQTATRDEPYLAFDPCAYALLAGPGCPGR